MRKAISIFAIASLLLLAMALTEAKADQSGTITITVSVGSSLSLELLDSEGLPCNSVELGTVGVGSVVTSGESICVRNNGSGVAEVFSLSQSYSGDWTSDIAPGDETFALNAGFGFPDSPEMIDWRHVDSLTSGATEYGNSCYLWFQFNAPTGTATTETQSITVTVTAQLP